MNIINSLIGGKKLTGRELKENISPVDKKVDSQVSLLSQIQLNKVYKKAISTKTKEKNDFSELITLAKYFKKNNNVFVQQIIRDAGFIQKDAQDLVDASIEFCKHYHKHLTQIKRPSLETNFSFKIGSNQKIKLASSPFGIIAATTPRNTPLITELTIIIHAIWSGNIPVLRPSPGVAGTISLLIEGLLSSFKKETLTKVFIVFASAKDFVDVSLNHAQLLHYVGSSKYLENTLIAGIKKGVKVLVDGDGCSLVLVDSSVDVAKAAQTCYEGLIRCNGQICISVRVIVIEKSVYRQFLSYFLKLIKNTVVQPPIKGNRPDMGPLFSSAQVNAIIEVSKKYSPLISPAKLKFGENYVTPTVLELKPTDKTFLRESLFGPIVGISHYEGDGWKRWLIENPINLTDVLLSKNISFINDFISISNSPRKVLNADPTIESVFEPWGAFLPSGWNDVSYWYSKYRNYFQLVR